MTFTLNTVVPWGRSFDEYVLMFAMTKDDLKRRILGCGDGPAAFNSRMAEMGRHVVSCDPLYKFSRQQIETRMHEARAAVMQQVRENLSNFIWERIRDLEELEKVRMTAMQEFLADYEKGLAEGRYCACSLPDLPFSDNEFDLSLCSHFLFLYPDTGFEFHLAALREMARVSREARIYPIVSANCESPPFLDELLSRLEDDALVVEIAEVDYDFLRNGTCMLKLYNQS